MPGTVRATKPPRALRNACESSSGGKSLGPRQRDKGHRRPDGAAREGAQAAGLGAGAPACAAGAKAAAEAGAGAGAAAPLPGDRRALPRGTRRGRQRTGDARGAPGRLPARRREHLRLGVRAAGLAAAHEPREETALGVQGSALEAQRRRPTVANMTTETATSTPAAATEPPVPGEGR